LPLVHLPQRRRAVGFERCMKMTDDMSLHGRSILVIEDDLILAETLAELLEDAGASVVGPIGKRDEALAFIDDDDNRFDTVLLDVNLHGQPAYPIADQLIERRIPFVFTTGDSVDGADATYAAYPRCAKPYRQKTLLAMLASVRV
jgi:CheY-like chemotaxis protein